MRKYEVMFILRPDLADEDVDKLISGFEGHITNNGGKLLSSDRMGKRRLAYDVRKFSDGAYVLFVLEADGKAIHELERRLRVTEQVIKFITVRTDETEKRLDKVKKLRASKVRTSTQQPAAAPAPEAVAAVEPAPAEGAPAQA